jgi:dynein regulatory complex protein 1
MADQETKEFDTNVADADERKRIRAQRFEARRDAEKGALDKANEERKAAERSQGKQQIAESLSHLDKKKSAGIEKVTDVRVAADWREAQRRVAEEKKRQDRLQRLQEEAVSSGKQNAIIEARWAELVEQNIPRELHDAIAVQKEACAEILRSKDELIKEFRQELKKKDEEYVKALKQQKEDINQLLERMRQEFKELQGEYEVELEAIEDAFLAERDELLDKNRGKIDQLYEKRKEAELKFLENRRAREEKHRQEIEDMLVKDGEEYNKLKIKLENDVQTLERQLEEMRATYQLNTEKLDYNYRVLTERDSENSTTLQQLKRKQNKLKDVLSRVMAKYQETDERDKNENERLTEEYKRMTKAYRDLQLKFRHFEVTDRQKFDRVWQMHEAEVNELVGKVLQADELIHRQQLGWDWKPPDLEALRALARPDAATQAREEALERKRLEEEEAARPKVSGAKLKACLELLSSEAGFLVEKKVRDALDELPEDEAELAQAESLLRALGARDDADISLLVSKFFSDGPADTEGEGDAAARALATRIKPEDVVGAAQSFVEERRRNAALKPPAADTVIGAEPVGLAAEREKERHAKQREYWTKMANVVSDDTFEVWQELEKQLEKYNTVLKQRSQEIARVTSLQEQNAQLKALINQYLNAKVNDELIVPPAATIAMNQQAAQTSAEG